MTPLARFLRPPLLLQQCLDDIWRGLFARYPSFLCMMLQLLLVVLWLMVMMMVVVGGCWCSHSSCSGLTTDIADVTVAVDATVFFLRLPTQVHL